MTGMDSELKAQHVICWKNLVKCIFIFSHLSFFFFLLYLERFSNVSINSTWLAVGGSIRLMMDTVASMFGKLKGLDRCKSVRNAGRVPGPVLHAEHSRQ